MKIRDLETPALIVLQDKMENNLSRMMMLLAGKKPRLRPHYKTHKSPHIAAPDGRLWLLDRPNSGLAKGGSGDVLAGCIAAFLAQGLDAPTAALLGAAVHSRAGARAAERLGKYGMLPRDVIESIPAAIKELEEGIL